MNEALLKTKLYIPPLRPDAGVAINMYTGWAELFLCLWLLIKGVDIEEWENRALEPAFVQPVTEG